MKPVRPRLITEPNFATALEALCEGLCPHRRTCMHCQKVDADSIPPPFSELLIHHDHMTARLSAFHRRPVALRVLDYELDEELYRRKIVLFLEGTNHIVEFGVVRIHLASTPDDVRMEILDRHRPLGDILIHHDVLRNVSPRWYLMISTGCPLLHDISCHAAAQRHLHRTYGRIGTISFNGEPAIELLEVITGIDAIAEGPGTPTMERR